MGGGRAGARGRTKKALQLYTGVQFFIMAICPATYAADEQGFALIDRIPVKIRSAVRWGWAGEAGAIDRIRVL